MARAVARGAARGAVLYLGAGCLVAGIVGVLVHDSYIVLTRPVVKRPELWSPEAGMPPPLQGSSSETKAPGLKATPSLDLEPTPAPAPPLPRITLKVKRSVKL
ncbi:MAG: hypothetical protein WDW38_000063 [Sanguina aurantia]